MKREIKFRAWETNKVLGSKMTEPFTLNDIHNRKYVASIFADEIIYMQFTGLKDENGKEIYEGDITDRGIIEYRNGCYKLLSTKPFFSYGFLGDWENQCKVIGNIYENPELCKD